MIGKLNHSPLPAEDVWLEMVSKNEDLTNELSSIEDDLAGAEEEIKRLEKLLDNFRRPV